MESSDTNYLKEYDNELSNKPFSVKQNDSIMKRNSLSNNSVLNTNLNSAMKLTETLNTL